MPISVRGRRNEPAGWPTDTVAEAVPTRRERLANNTPLWIACLIAVLLLCFGLIISSGGRRDHDVTLIKALAPGDSARGYYNDPQHQAFVERFVAMERKRGVDVEAEFISENEFKIVVASDVGYDEISYLSRFAALGIKRRFGNGAIIYAYNRDNKNPNKIRLTATTQWSERENSFITKPERAMEVE